MHIVLTFFIKITKQNRPKTNFMLYKKIVVLVAQGIHLFPERHTRSFT